MCLWNTAGNEAPSPNFPVLHTGKVDLLMHVFMRVRKIRQALLSLWQKVGQGEKRALDLWRRWSCRLGRHRDITPNNLLCPAQPQLTGPKLQTHAGTILVSHLGSRTAKLSTTHSWFLGRVIAGSLPCSAHLSPACFCNHHINQSLLVKGLGSNFTSPSFSSQEGQQGDDETHGTKYSCLQKKTPSKILKHF